MTADFVKALRGPLEVEARTGYRDAAVIGQSVADYARAWAARADAAGLPSTAAALAAQIADLLAAYGSATPAQRRTQVAKAKRLLGLLVRPSPEKKAAAPERGQEAGAAVDARLAEGPLKRQGWVRRLAKLGIETTRDLLYHFPRDYAPVRRIGELSDGEQAAVVARTGAREESVVREGRGRRLMRFALQIADDTGRAWVTSFARVPRQGARARAIMGGPLGLNYPEGTLVLIEGAARRAGGWVEIQYSDSERVAEAEAPAPGTLAPIYPLTDGVYQGQVRRAVRRALAELPELPDPLPEPMRRRYGLPELRRALQDIHWPASLEVMEAARRRLAFEELVTVQVALAQQRQERRRPGAGIAMPPRGDVVAALEEVLPYSLTRAQQRVISEIAADMATDSPMQRLVQGDVGSGKTVVAAGALLIALQRGYQGALMAPTELLAEQHYLVLSRMLAPLGVAVELLTGAVRGREREEAYRRIAQGRAQVVLGTHALIQEGVEFARLGVVIVDEQHRFGVRQRGELLAKGRRPHLLVMTATPIPRTLALTLYGDLDVSLLDEMPPGRTPVRTLWAPLERPQEAYELVRRELEAGRQAYVVCPLIEESEALQAEAATELARKLREEVFPDRRVGLLHGAMGVKEKDAVVQAFRAGEIEVLCATTVVEVGVDVPNATVMLVLNADCLLYTSPSPRD